MQQSCGTCTLRQYREHWLAIIEDAKKTADQKMDEAWQASTIAGSDMLEFTKASNDAVAEFNKLRDIYNEDSKDPRYLFPAFRRKPLERPMRHRHVTQHSPLQREVKPEDVIEYPSLRPASTVADEEWPPSLPAEEEDAAACDADSWEDKCEQWRLLEEEASSHGAEGLYDDVSNASVAAIAHYEEEQSLFGEEADEGGGVSLSVTEGRDGDSLPQLVIELNDNDVWSEEISRR